MVSSCHLPDEDDADDVENYRLAGEDDMSDSEEFSAYCGETSGEDEDTDVCKTVYTFLSYRRLNEQTLPIVRVTWFGANNKKLGEAEALVDTGAEVSSVSTALCDLMVASHRQGDSLLCKERVTLKGIGGRLTDTTESISRRVQCHIEGDWINQEYVSKTSSNPKGYQTLTQSEMELESEDEDPEPELKAEMCKFLVIDSGYDMILGNPDIVKLRLHPFIPYFLNNCFGTSKREKASSSVKPMVSEIMSCAAIGRTWKRTEMMYHRVQPKLDRRNRPGQMPQSSTCKKCRHKWVCKKNPPELHDLCHRCEDKEARIRRDPESTAASDGYLTDDSLGPDTEWEDADVFNPSDSEGSQASESENQDTTSTDWCEAAKVVHAFNKRRTMENRQGFRTQGGRYTSEKEGSYPGRAPSRFKHKTEWWNRTPKCRSKVHVSLESSNPMPRMDEWAIQERLYGEVLRALNTDASSSSSTSTSNPAEGTKSTARSLLGDPPDEA